MTGFKQGEVYRTDEPSAWLRTTSLARVRELLPIIVFFPADVVMTVLVEPHGDQTPEQWERTCDRCGKYHADDDTFMTGETAVASAEHEKIIVLTFGLCVECAEKETNRHAT